MTRVVLFLVFGILLKHISAQPPINILSIQQGLPKSQIYDIVQDTFGFIWLGTRDGLVKFDGTEVSVFKKGTSEFPVQNGVLLSLHRRWQYLPA